MDPKLVSFVVNLFDCYQEKFRGLSSKWRENIKKVDKDQKAIRQLVNLLTPEVYRKLQPKFLSYLGTTKTIDMLVGQIMKSSWTQPKYTQIYADISKELSQKSQV